MKEKNKVFARVFDWLYQHEMAIDQSDISKKTGISPTTISRIMNHGVGRPDEKTIRKLNAAFGNIFNPDFLRGQSEKMLMEELSPDSNAINSNQHQLSSIIPDYGSMTNAIIAAKDDAIMALKKESAAKDDTIIALRGQLKDKDATIASKDAHLAEKDARLADKQAMIVNLQEQVADLKHRLAAYQSKELLGDYPFKMGAADDGSRPSVGK